MVEAVGGGATVFGGLTSLYFTFVCTLPVPSYWICLCLPQIERLMLHDIPCHKVLDGQGFPKPLS